MKTTYLKLAIALLMLSIVSARAQTVSASRIEALSTFNEQQVREEFLQHHSPNDANYAEYLQARKQTFLQDVLDPTEKTFLPPPTVQSACTNMDFESGDLTGWTSSTGFNPLYNSNGCCPTAGGAQMITSGAGTDPCGGFPVVCPGGSFSVKIGDNNVGGVADRLEQTFSVTNANANYTYRYAVVLEDPGHTQAEQPSFQIDMLDASGVQIPCTFYQVSAGQGIPGFQNSTVCNNVIYKPWTTVSVDLSSYVGQNVTIRFTTYDCALGGHFGYAYVDGSCLSYQLQLMDTLCIGGTAQLCAPDGFQTYSWSGPGVVGQSNNCATINAPGTYSVQLTTVTGCNTPLITYSVSNYPNPVASFGVIGGNNACNLTVGFNNTSNLGNNMQLNYLWDFGDGTSSFMEQPTHTYLNQGTYTVTLIATGATTGCADTTTQVVIIDIPPAPQFSTSGVCAGSAIQFTNQTPGINGSETWLWDFSDNTTATTQNATHIFAVAGTYNVQLTITNANGCSGSSSNNVTVYPLPNPSFTSTQVCEGLASSFNNTSSIPSGTIVGYQWDFNADGNPDNSLSNPSYTFPASGSFNVQLTVTSNAGCSASVFDIAFVKPNPAVGFSGNNACQAAYNMFQNTSSVALPSQITNYHWNFGDGDTSNALNPQHNYNAAGTFTVTLNCTTESGCTGSYSFPITIYPKPNTTFAATDVCHTQTTQFSDQSTVPGGTISSRAWDFNGDGVVDATIANPTFVYSSYGSYNAKLETISNNGCYGQTVEVVLVYANPVASFTASSQCLGDAVVFNDQSISTDGVISNYSWDFESDGSIDNISSSPSYTYPAYGTHLASLQIQTEYGCESSFQAPVRINPLPYAQFNAPITSGCPELCINFKDSSSIASGYIASYFWDFGDQSSTSSLQNPENCFSTGTFDISLTVTSDSGCISKITKTGMISVYPQPDAAFTINSDDPDVINPEISVVDNSNGASSLYYSIDNGYSTSDNDFTYLFNSDNGQTYYITQFVENTYGCKDSVTKPIEIKPAFTFYIPNAFSPNNDGINDGFKGEGIGINDYKIWIFDRWGNMIFYSEDINKAWDGTFQKKSSTTVMQDVYVWKVELKDVFDKKHNYAGTVAVVR